jgi:hypothetical protein
MAREACARHCSHRQSLLHTAYHLAVHRQPTDSARQLSTNIDSDKPESPGANSTIASAHRTQRNTIRNPTIAQCATTSIRCTMRGRASPGLTPLTSANVGDRCCVRHSGKCRFGANKNPAAEIRCRANQNCIHSRALVKSFFVPRKIQELMHAPCGILSGMFARHEICDAKGTPSRDQRRRGCSAGSSHETTHTHTHTPIPERQVCVRASK